MFLFWPGTSNGHSSCVLFACPFEVRDRCSTSTSWAVVRRPWMPWLAAHLVPSLCAARIQQHSSTVQHPQGPRAQPFLEQFQVITFWLFNFRRNMRPKGNCWSCLGNFEIHRAQVPLPNSSFFEKPRENKLRQCSTIAGTDGKCSMAASSLRKVFSMILNGCIFIPINLRSIQSPQSGGRQELIWGLHPSRWSTLSRTTRNKLDTPVDRRGMASLVSRNRVVSPERQQRDWQRQKNDFTVDKNTCVRPPALLVC